MKPAAFRTLATLTAHQNPRFRLLVDEVERPGGMVGPYYWIDLKAGATVLPVSSDLHVVLVREYKHPLKSISIEAISGGIEDGETARQCGARELREEGGLEAAHWLDLGRVDPLTSSVLGPNYLFVASGLRQTAQALEEGEQLEVIQMPLAEAVDMAIDGRISHGTTATLLLKVSELLRRHGPKFLLGPALP